MISDSLSCRSVFESKFEELEQSIFGANREVFDEQTFSKDNFLRTAAVMRARVHPPLDNDQITLVPLADQVWRPRTSYAFGEKHFVELHMKSWTGCAETAVTCGCLWRL